MVSRKYLTALGLSASAALLGLGVLLLGAGNSQAKLAARTVATSYSPGPISQGQTVPPAVEDITPPHPYGAPMTSPAEAVALAMRGTGEVKAATRSQAKLTTWAEVVAASAMFKNGGPVPTLQVPGSEKVWVVAISGVFVPEFANGKTFAWGVIVYDANTNAVLTEMAGGSGSWPTWFDSMSAIM